MMSTNKKPLKKSIEFFNLYKTNLFSDYILWHNKLCDKLSNKTIKDLSNNINEDDFNSYPLLKEIKSEMIKFFNMQSDKSLNNIFLKQEKSLNSIFTNTKESFYKSLIQSEMNTLYHIAKYEEEDFFELFKHKITPKVSIFEYEWLKTTLLDDSSKYFFDDEELNNLNNWLKEYNKLFLDSFVLNKFLDKKIFKEDITHTRRVIRTFIDALNNNQTIIYEQQYKDKDNNIHTSTRESIPNKIEYSIKNQMIRLSILSLDKLNKLDESRIIKVLPQNILNIRIGNPISKENHNLFIEKSKEKIVTTPITIQVNKDYQDEFFSLLSTYDKIVDWSDINSNNSYVFVELYIYEFDNKEILRDLLSLGSKIKVISSPIINKSYIKGDKIISYQENLKNDLKHRYEKASKLLSKKSNIN